MKDNRADMAVQGILIIIYNDWETSQGEALFNFLFISKFQWCPYMLAAGGDWLLESNHMCSVCEDR